MARLPVPDRGQPIDVPYIYLMSTVINDLADQIDASTEKYTSINTRDVGVNTLRTSDTKFFASFQDLFSEEDVTVNQTKEFRFEISGFKYPPVAVVTPVNTKGNETSNDVTVAITSTTNSEIKGIVRFNTAGKVSVAVNVIAIGVPG